jgi:predicted nucleic acid-binding protein
MSGHEFVDSTIWLYALVEPTQTADSDKRLRAAGFIGQLKRPVISSQVVCELCCNLLQG